MKIRAFVLVLATVLLAADSPPRMPIPNNYADSILTRWLTRLPTEFAPGRQSYVRFRLPFHRDSE